MKANYVLWNSLLCCSAWAAADASRCMVDVGDRHPTCKEGKCTAPVLNMLFCSQCNKKSYAPIEGRCYDVEAEDTKSNRTICKTHSDGKCLTCGSDYFIYKGGC